MKKSRLLIIVLLFLFSLSSSGCFPLFVGGASFLAGYAISKDTIQGETDKDYNTLWNAAKTVARIKGKVKTEDKTRGYLELKVGSSRVIVQLSRLTKTTTRLRVSARRMGLPNIELAQDIFVKILEQAS